jgi:integrase
MPDSNQPPSDVDLDKGEVSVRQRADRYNTIGRPKSWSGNRTVPIGPFVRNVLREWKFVCPKGALDLVFPTGNGNIESRGNILKNLLWPAEIAAGVTVPKLDRDGKPVTDEIGKSAVKAKYAGLHSLRHFYASWCINRKVDGGLELPAKVVQERLGHANIAMTLDTYGHLFPRGDDGREL